MEVKGMKSMKQTDVVLYSCEVVRKEYHLVGQSITANYSRWFPDAALQVQIEFWKRKHEINNPLHDDILLSPYMMPAQLRFITSKGIITRNG